LTSIIVPDKEIFFGKAMITNHGMNNDWCHICGERSDNTADVRFPENAEHDEELTRYVRVCGSCADAIGEKARRGRPV
jgi:hypothetical protein